jgi:DnaK suppressor protein
MARKEALLRLHGRLVTRRDALRKALNGDLNALRDYATNDIIGDNIDAAVDTANDEITSQLVEIESRELEQIEQALTRIERGVYGRCEFCGGRIAEPRLNALPYTNSCIDCQRENERLGINRPNSTSDDGRWAKIDDKGIGGDADHDREINLNDFEMDLTETGR